MTIETKVTRRFKDNYVQLDVRVNNSNVRYYKLPENQVDTFVSQYKKYDTNTRIFSNIWLFLLGFGGAATGVIASSLFKAPKPIKYLAGIALCALGCYGSTKMTENKMIKEEAILLKNNNAEQIFYDENKII